MGGHGWGFLLFLVGTVFATLGGFMVAHRSFLLSKFYQARGELGGPLQHTANVILVRNVFYLVLGLAFILASFILIGFLGGWVVLLWAVFGFALYYIIRFARR